MSDNQTTLEGLFDQIGQIVKDAQEDRDRYGQIAATIRINALRHGATLEEIEAMVRGEKDFIQFIQDKVTKYPPEIEQLIDAAQWARNRLDIIADESWHGDGRDLKRSVIGIFADFDEALQKCGSVGWNK